MRTRVSVVVVILFSFVFSVALIAQKAPPARPQPGEREPQPWRNSERMGDEVAMRKSIDAPVLKTAAFKEAIRNYKPDTEAVLLATWGEFVTADGTEFVALQLAPAPGTSLKADSRVAAFGEFVDPSGRSQLTFEELLPVRQSKGDVFVERSFIFPAPKLLGTFGLAVRGEVIGMTRVDFDQEPLTRSSAGLSRIILSDNVYTLPTLQKPLDPFAFGGTKVVPKPGGAFRKSDEVWIFAEVRNPAVDAGKSPHMLTKIELTGNGKKIAGPATPAEASPLKGVPGHFGVGQTLDVSRFAAGDYSLRYTVIDTLAKQTYQRETQLRIGE